MSFNCRTTGLMPVEITASPDLTTGIAPEGFVDGRLWELHPELDVRPGTVGTHADRMFPSVELVMIVGRQPRFFLLNIALPVFFFVPMACLQFTVPRDNTEARLSVSMAIVLTAVAHKYSMTSLVPAISYLTFLDKYVLASLLLITIITFQGGLVGCIELFYCRFQAVFEEDEADAAVVERRNLLISSSGGLDNTEVMPGNVPIYYLDKDCPYYRMGRFNKFDMIDMGLMLGDVFLWLLLQCWAVAVYLVVQGNLAKRVKEMKRSREAMQTAKAQAAADAKPALARAATKPALQRTNTQLKNFAHLSGASAKPVEEGADRYTALEQAAAACRIQAQARGRKTRKNLLGAVSEQAQKQQQTGLPPGIRVADAAVLPPARGPRGPVKLMPMSPARTAPLAPVAPAS